MECKTQIQMYLSVFGDTFEPVDLTDILGIVPTEIGYKGEEIPPFPGLTRKGPNPLRKETFWHYSTGYIETLNSDDNANILLGKFQNKVEIIKEYTKQYDLSVKIFCVIEIVDDNKPALGFQKAFIKFVSDLDAEIDMDLYIFNNEDLV